MYKIAKATFRNRGSSVASLFCYLQTRSISRQSKVVKTKTMVEKEDMNVTRVLFCGPHFPNSNNFTREYLQPYPFIQVDVVPIPEVPEMKLIMQYGVGLEGVDIDAATKYGIKVARIPSEGTGNAASCSEMAIYLMLGLLKKQNEMQISVRSRLLGVPAGDTLFGKTVFILGYGNIGRELAKRLKPFESRVIATKRSWTASINDSDSSLVDEKGSHEDIYTFAGKADIVVVCLTLNKETADVVNNKFICSMKKGALLINISRGGLINYESTYENLESGHLGGLGIDVAWSEPFDPNDPILKFKNVIITPHVAGVTEYSYLSMAKIVGDVALQLHEGLPLTGIEFVN
ncbi:D-3-phosphoglycerate dehydrogenase 1 [Cardamine amara subsp. amara]|uniref:D-3-phosphoglycerate dehydrogenase 1 n=1 Tax=Cardamine amara subsp. amara TaxID=228776 RepID=A0ABD1BRS7_CARAN